MLAFGHETNLALAEHEGHVSHRNRHADPPRLQISLLQRPVLEQALEPAYEQALTDAGWTSTKASRLLN